MKKIYIIPTTDIVYVELQQMIAESLDKCNNYNGEDEILSRDYDMDDDWD